MRIFKFNIFILLVIFFTGCTHKINITPNNEKIINRDYEIDKKNYNVAYYIEEPNLIFVTKAGGGDSVSYLAYKETEAAFRSVLVKHFNKVYSIDNLNDKQFLSDKNIKIIFNYKLETYSYSEGVNNILFWPPTKFIITINIKAINIEDKIKWEKILTGEGNALSNEFMGDFSISGKKATENVFNKLLYELNTKELKEIN